MKAKKDNENNKMKQITADEARWEKLVMEAGRVELDGRDFVMPPVSLNTGLTIAQQLVVQAPPVLGEGEKVALAGVEEAIVVGRAHLNRVQRRALKKNALVERNLVLARLNRVTTALDGFEDSNREVEAAEVKEAVFAAVVDPSSRTQRELWESVAQVKELLDANPALAARLEALVTGDRMVRLFEANDGLGEAIGIAVGFAPAVLLDAGMVTAFVRRRVMAYIIQVLAAAGGSLARAERAAGALRAVTELRAELAARRARRKAKAATEELDDEESELDDEAAEGDVDSPVTTAPATTAPVAVAPGGDA